MSHDPDQFDRGTLGWQNPAGYPDTATGPAEVRVSEPRSRNVWWLLGFGSLCLTFSVVALVVVLTSGSDATSTSADVPQTPNRSISDAASASSSVTTSNPAPTTTAVPATPTTTTLPPQQTMVSITGVVARTCGRSGRGDCFLAVRSAPDSRATELRRIDEGSSISVACTVTGERVVSSVLGSPTYVWARTGDGGFVSMAFIDAPGWDLFTDDHPC